MTEIEASIGSLVSASKKLKLEVLLMELEDIKYELLCLEGFDDVDYVIELLREFLEKKIKVTILKEKLKEVGLKIQDTYILSPYDSKLLALKMQMERGK